MSWSASKSAALIYTKFSWFLVFPDLLPKQTLSSYPKFLLEPLTTPATSLATVQTVASVIQRATRAVPAFGSSSGHSLGESTGDGSTVLG